MTVDIVNRLDSTTFIFENDRDNKRLRLLVIISPILIASFDNGDYDLEYFKKTISNSKFQYGLYPEFFNNFSLSDYFKSYENYCPSEDIILNNDNKIEFTINPVNENLEKSMVAIISGLILDDDNLDYYLDYFAKIRDDIVINGRRSILANGIQGFFLSRYVVVWMIDICEYLIDSNKDLTNDLRPIYKLATELKKPGDVK